MTEQYHFETSNIEFGNIPRRVRAVSAKLRAHAQSEARKEREIEVKRQTVIQLRTMIAGLEREIANLDLSIRSELELSRVREPSHFAYPILARTMQGRRENLQATVAALSDRLALTELIHDHQV
jgi:hypothetical protein